MITPFAVLIVSRVRGRQRSRAARWSSLPTNYERRVDAVDKRWNKITQSLEILKKRVESLSSNMGVEITSSLQKKIPSSLVIHSPVGNP